MLFLCLGFSTAINLFAKLGYSNTDLINHSGGYGVYFDGELYPQLSGNPTNINDTNVAFIFKRYKFC